MRSIFFALLFSLLVTSCHTQNKELDKLIDGEWFVVSTTDTAWMAYGTMRFDTDKHTYGNYDGCNWLSGDYYYVGNKIVLEDSPSTCIACPCFGRSGYPGSEPVNVEKIRFFDTDGIAFTRDSEPRVFLLKQGKWMLNGSWNVVEIGGKDVSGNDIVMLFDNSSDSVSIQEPGITIDLSFTVNKQTHISFLPENFKPASCSNSLNNLINLLKTVTVFSPSPDDLPCSVVILLKNAEQETVVKLQRSETEIEDENDFEEVSTSVTPLK